MPRRVPIEALCFFCLIVFCQIDSSPGQEAMAPARPLVGEDVVFEEVDGVVAVEAEHFFKQTQTDTRAWYLFTSKASPTITPDPDKPHLQGATGGAYLEILPDTRSTHGDRLIRGENFSNDPGKLGVLHYKVHFNTPGRYYVWGRIYSTGTEDNGLHVGIDGTWPESGQRMQWIAKRRWAWQSRQRTAQKHGGEPFRLYLDVEKAGTHVISFAMREDGTEFDKWMMTTEKLKKVEGEGPRVRLKQGKLPQGAPEAREGDASNEPRVPRAKESRSRRPDGDGSVSVGGELMQWHKVTLTQKGPFAHEQDNAPNPFLDYRMTVTFRHESGKPVYQVPGYFAADGDAANTSAESGTCWRAHLCPDKPGQWSYRVSFVKGPGVAVEDSPAAPVAGCDGKTGKDFRARGRLEVVGKHHLRFAGSGEYFLKVGADAPENLLAYKDFDGDFASDGHKDDLVKTWAPHQRDWREGDPTWQGHKGKGLIGAINYLASQGLNAFSFLPMNIQGDDRNVFPYPRYDDRERMDCSRLDQWEIVFSHGDRMGMYLHFKTQETENELLLDRGELGPHRKLYYRELIARFSHHLALNWNLGEEINNASTAQKKAWARYFHETDPYRHHIVIHNGANHYDLMGPDSHVTGMSVQTNRPTFERVHQRTLDYIRRSVKAGKPWVVACDEPGDASHALRPDDDAANSHRDARKNALWGCLMAGGAGVEFYFGYRHAHSDLTCQDFRSRSEFWPYCRRAHEFFTRHVPFWEMSGLDEKVDARGAWCLAKEGEVYLVYLPDGGTTGLDLPAGRYTVGWYDPRNGGDLQKGSVRDVAGGGNRSLGTAPRDPEKDWAILVKKAR